MGRPDRRRDCPGRRLGDRGRRRGHPDDRTTTETPGQRVGPKDRWLSVLEPDGRTRHAVALDDPPEAVLRRDIRRPVLSHGQFLQSQRGVSGHFHNHNPIQSVHGSQTRTRTQEQG